MSYNDFCFDSNYEVFKPSTIKDSTGQRFEGYTSLMNVNGEFPVRGDQSKAGQGNNPKTESSITSINWVINLDPKQFDSSCTIKEGMLIVEKEGFKRAFLIQTREPVLDPFRSDYIWFYQFECTQQTNPSYKIF